MNDAHSAEATELSTGREELVKVIIETKNRLEAMLTPALEIYFPIVYAEIKDIAESLLDEYRSVAGFDDSYIAPGGYLIPRLGSWPGRFVREPPPCCGQ